MKPKSGMQASRYHHSTVYDSKRSRIYVFGGVGIDNFEVRPRFDSSFDFNSDHFDSTPNGRGGKGISPL